MFLSSLGEAGSAHPPVLPACFTLAVRSRIAPLIHLILRNAVVLCIAILCVACESAVLRQVNYYEKIGDNASIIQYLENELQRRPDNVEARYLLAKALFNEQRFAEGRRTFDEIGIQTSRYNDSIHFILESGYRESLEAGIAALEEKNIDAGLIQLKYATEIRPEYNPGHRLLGFAQTQAGQLDSAALSYQQAVMLEPTDFESWHNLSDISFQNQDYEAARNFAKEALNLNPGSVTATRRLAHAHMHLREHNEATTVFENLLSMNAEVHDVKDYAFFLFNIGEFEASLPHLESLRTVMTPSVELLKTLGETYTGLKQFKKVVEVNEEILSQSPDDRAAIGNLIAAHERLGHFEQAKQWQERLAALGGEM